MIYVLHRIRYSSTICEFFLSDHQLFCLPCNCFGAFKNKTVILTWLPSSVDQTPPPIKLDVNI